MVSNKPFKLKTVRNYELMEVRSALQKCLRRGQIEESLYWACELYESNYEKYLFYTLATIVAEDIGHFDSANYSAMNSALNLWYTIFIDRKKAKQRTEIRPALGSIIILMASAKKTRVGDDAWMFMELSRKQGLHLDIPDVAIDEHCRKGRELKRSFRFWVRQASKIHPKVRAEELGLKTDYSSELNRWYMKNSPVHDEPDYNEWTHLQPDDPIVEVEFKGVENEE